MVHLIDNHINLLSFAAPAQAADNDYNLIKIINKIDNDKHDDVFRTMHDPNHRHPRHRGMSICMMMRFIYIWPIVERKKHVVVVVMSCLPVFICVIPVNIIVLHRHFVFVVFAHRLKNTHKFQISKKL